MGNIPDECIGCALSSEDVLSGICDDCHNGSNFSKSKTGRTNYPMQPQFQQPFCKAVSGRFSSDKSNMEEVEK